MKITGYMIAHMKENGYISVTHCPNKDRLDTLVERGVVSSPYIVFDYDNLEDPSALKICPDDPQSDFFDCWQFDHPETPAAVIVDMDKAKSQWMDHLKEIRDDRLKYLDKQMVIALGAKDQDRVDYLEEIKQKLRDLPEYVDFSIVTKPADLYDVYPAVLLAE